MKNIVELRVDIDNAKDSRNLPTTEPADGLPLPPPRLFFAGLIEKLRPTLKIPAKYQVRWFRPRHPTSDQPGIHNATGFSWENTRFSVLGN